MESKKKENKKLTWAVAIGVFVGVILYKLVMSIFFN
jgi:hypothetical protein